MIPYDKMSLKSFVVIVLVGLVAAADGAVSLARPFGDNMVLQQGKPVAVWGWADPGADVSLSFAGQCCTTVAASDGRWKVRLAPLVLSKTGRSLTVRSRQKVGAAETLTATNVLVGEVWVLSGQSNMEWGISGTDDWPEVRKRANYPLMRYMANAGCRLALSPCTDLPCSAHWEPVTTNNVKMMSAVGFYFGERLMQDRDVPIGLVFAAHGGTSMLNWTSREWLLKCPYQRQAVERYDRRSADWVATNGYHGAVANYRKQLEKYCDDVHLAKLGKYKGPGGWPWPPPSLPLMFTGERLNAIPSIDYNAVIAPLAGLSVAGVLWYQGETESWAWNPQDPAWHFSEMLENLIACWRGAWGEDIWFVVSQLASMSTAKAGHNGMPVTRVRQYETARRLPRVAAACIADTGREHDVHPHDKTLVGERLAHVARRSVYGETQLSRMPEALSAAFDDAAALVSVDCDTPLSFAGEPRGFEVKVAGAWEPARRVEICGKSLRVTPSHGKPEGVRYLWTGWAKPLVSVYDAQKLPLNSFSFPLEVK